MARKPRDLIVRFIADVNAFLRGTDQVEDAFRDVARQQDQLVAEGQDSARDLARAYDRAGDKIARDAKASQAKTRKAYADTGKEAGAEFAQNLGESVSSGDVSGLLSGTAGGLAATFGAAGPIGLALAGLAAAGTVAFGAISAAAEKARQAAEDAFDDLLSKADKATKLQTALAGEYGSFADGLLEIQKISEKTGIPVERIADAFAAGGEEARTLADEAERMARANNRAALNTRGAAYGPTDKDVTNAQALAGALDRRATATERAAKAEQTRADALRESGAYFQRAYGVGSSTYNSQVPSLYRTEKR